MEFSSEKSKGGREGGGKEGGREGGKEGGQRGGRGKGGEGKKEGMRGREGWRGGVDMERPTYLEGHFCSGSWNSLLGIGEAASLS